MQTTNILHTKYEVMFLKSIKEQIRSKEERREKWGSVVVVYIDINMSQERHNFDYSLFAEVVEKIRKFISDFTI